MIGMEALKARYRVAEDPLRSERRLELVVVILAAVLLFWIVLGTLSLVISSGPDPLPPAADSLEVSESLRPFLVDDEGSATILARPLLWESRTSLDPADAIAASKPVEKAPSAKRLKGVKVRGVFGVGDSLGVIASVDGKLTRVRSGEAIKGWTLQGVDGRRVEFSSGGGVDYLDLEVTTPAVSVFSPAGPDVEGADGVGSEAATQNDAATAEGGTAEQAPTSNNNAGGGLTVGGYGTGQ
ncbi:conserved hypothetical protein [Luminiphilus syltensis NOR5-1B]|uniref:Type II secretion system protein GspC N-terminal domain-containing protein n=1 Tax=Luminiphilus syltensis NOR5-1B TaxID=565045 RepID=B8KWZ0_9GAMM|nr:hypothetical protein [Luminiphilus syltensis]EED34611.1 conserved hypothetical protein [Luminiphilus syltensis NOR5-1B]